MPDKSSHRPISPAQLKHPVVLLAAGFGSGCAPKAPGTAGTLIAVPMVWAMQSLSLSHYLLVTLLVISALGAAATVTYAQDGEVDQGTGLIVIDWDSVNWWDKPLPGDDQGDDNDSQTQGAWCGSSCG